MRLLRMTTRRWMAVVAALALVLGAMVGIWRRARWFERSRPHAQDAFTYADAAWGCLRVHLRESGDGIPRAGACADRYWELYDYHGRLEEKYAMAASRPWLPVEPDPPSRNEFRWAEAVIYNWR